MTGVGRSRSPSWRVDVHRDVDLIEEVGRHHGFEHLPTTFPGVQQAPAPSDPRIARDARVRQVALASGFSEAISFAFIEARHADPFVDATPAVALANPLSEKFAVMRPSLVPGLVAAVGHNRRHGRRDIQLFEIGTRFSRQGESRALGLAWTGLATPDHWSGARRDADFFDMKGVVEAIAARFDATLDVDVPAGVRVPHRVLVPGRAAVVRRDTEIGRVARPARRPPSPTRTRCRPTTWCGWPSSISIAWRPPARRRRGAPRRCRAIRRRCATSRCSSTSPCLPRAFVAPFNRTRRRRWSTWSSSTATRGKAFRTAR